MPSGALLRVVSWPLVGREEELEWAAAARKDIGSVGLIFSGASGVGKTRLAKEVLAAAAADGNATEWIQATQAAASIPLGAVAGLAPEQARAEERLHLFQLCVGALRERALRQPLVLGVDDAHLLDPSSAALVLQMAQTRTAFVVVTVRAGEECPDAIVALWKDLEAPRLEVQQLSADETAALLEAALEGELSSSVRRWAYASSEGHVLYLRELVQGALAGGALVREGGVWRLCGRPQATPALVELISRSLDDLDDEQLEAARVLAFGEPVDLDTVALLAGSAALSELEDRGLAVVARSAAPSGEREVRLGHPLYGEVLRERTPIMRGMQLRLRLAQAVRAKGGLDRPGDALRVATWLEDSGVEIDEPLLLAAAREANAAGDLELAERLVLRASAGAEAALILASTYSRQRRFADAEALLAEWESALPRELAVAYLEVRAVDVLHLGLQRTGDAFALLDRAQRWFTDAEWRDQVRLIRGRLALLASPAVRPADALEGLGRLHRRGDVAHGVSRRASISYTWNLYEVGRLNDALALSAQLRPSLPLRGWDDSMAFVIWCVTRLEAGYEWDAVERWLAEADRISARGTDHLTRGDVVNGLAMVALRRGQPATAARRCREGIEILERSDLVRRLPGAWLKLAWSVAMRGDADAASAALAGYMDAAGGASIPYYRREEIIARAALARIAGETTRAVAMLLDGASDEYEILIRAHLLYEALRAGAEPRVVAPSLREVAVAASEAPLVRAFAMVVDARVIGDGAALIAAADAFGEIGAWLWAAESAAWAAEAYREAGRDDSARRATALSGELYAKCEDAWSPVLTTMDLAPSELTGRELEVTNLASLGASNAEIAQRLVLSVRTVETHMYRAMRKLGVSTREELRAR